jgi:hypothetical protein
MVHSWKLTINPTKCNRLHGYYEDNTGFLPQFGEQDCDAGGMYPLGQQPDEFAFDPRLMEGVCYMVLYI